MQKIESLSKVNTNTLEGRYLIAALTILTTTPLLTILGQEVEGSKKKPDEMILLTGNVAEEIYKDADAIPAIEETKQEQASLTTSGLSKPEGVDQKVWDAWINKMPQKPPFAPESGDHSKGSVDENGVKNDDEENIDGPKGHLK